MTNQSVDTALSRSQHAPEASPLLVDKRMSILSPRRFLTVILLEGWVGRWTIPRVKVLRIGEEDGNTSR